MRYKVFLLIAFGIAANVSPADASARDRIFETDSVELDKAFRQRMNTCFGNGGFEFVEKLEGDRKAGMEFLYSYLPSADIDRYSPEFLLTNVDATLKAVEEMPWGRDVPSRELLHFVLPPRVNNESLDSCRIVFYNELKDRVRDLSMKDAILEVNHWCHEKVTYRPSDARTSSPLSAVSQAIGRCGEESTLAVSALRAVGIPARQVYTPRWAHTDDNHAWVEAWADGRWYFLGACEPEPVLNLAWFNQPASRGMLMNTTVFGRYDGPEEVLKVNPLTTDINVTSNYAPVRKAEVQVLDGKGNPVKDAVVNFCIYNYAEFYPAVSKQTDSEGKASVVSGLGDMIVWAASDGKYSVTKYPGDKENLLQIVLDDSVAVNKTLQFDIVPPAGCDSSVEVSDVLRKQNQIRFAREDSIRHAYMSTFADSVSSFHLADELGIDGERLFKVLRDSRGNHLMIENLLKELTDDERNRAISLLEAVTEKDRRDISMDVLLSHVKGFRRNVIFDDAVNSSYILNPRIESEPLTDFRSSLSVEFADKAEEYRNNPSLLAEWVEKNIIDDGGMNQGNLRKVPVAVLDSRKADTKSRNIFFVAVARSLGIPARIDLVRGVAQYYGKDGKWVDVLRNSDYSESVGNSAKGVLKLDFTPHGYIVDPGYYTSFTLSKIENGLPILLEYDDEGTFNSLFSSSVEVDAGDYMLITGQRLANGSVLANAEFFTVEAGKEVEIPLEIRRDDEAVSVIGALDAENLYYDYATASNKSILSSMGRGFYMLGLVRKGHEPSAHTINDIRMIADRFGESREKCLLLFEDKTAMDDVRELVAGLPKNVVVGYDKDGSVFREVSESLNLNSKEMPVFLIADSFNRIVFASQGYSIGIGEQLLKTLSKIR